MNIQPSSNLDLCLNLVVWGNYWEYNMFIDINCSTINTGTNDWMTWRHDAQWAFKAQKFWKQSTNSSYTSGFSKLPSLVTIGRKSWEQFCVLETEKHLKSLADENLWKCMKSSWKGPHFRWDLDIFAETAWLRPAFWLVVLNMWRKFHFRCRYQSRSAKYSVFGVSIAPKKTLTWAKIWILVCPGRGHLSPTFCIV